MSIRDRYVELIKALGETIKDEAEDIIPLDIDHVCDIEIKCTLEPFEVVRFSWTVNSYVLENGHHVACEGKGERTL